MVLCARWTDNYTRCPSPWLISILLTVQRIPAPVANWGAHAPQHPHYSFIADRMVARGSRPPPKLGGFPHHEYIHQSVPPGKRADIITNCGADARDVVQPLLAFEALIQTQHWGQPGALPQIAVPKSLAQTLQLAPAGGV